MTVYVARVIPAFVMYCVNGASRSSLLIESTDSMILESGQHLVTAILDYGQCLVIVNAWSCSVLARSKGWVVSSCNLY